MGIHSFSQVLGSELLKLALVVVAIDPSLDGVVVSGPKGSGKSTTIHALESILPPMQVIDPSCPFHCNASNSQHICQQCHTKLQNNQASIHEFTPRVLTLPPSTSEENLWVSPILTETFYKDEHSIFARANNQYLLIDELNLHNEQITSLLLNPTPVNTTRGILIPHYVIMGAYNLEEGEINSHLADRFGLSVKLENIYDSDYRTQVIKANLLESTTLNSADQSIKSRITMAKISVTKIALKEDYYRIIANICSELHIEGNRGAIAALKTARCLAAYQGYSTLTNDDLYVASKLCLLHRSREDGTFGISEHELEQAFAKTIKKEVKKQNIEESSPKIPILPLYIKPILRRFPEFFIMFLLAFCVLLGAYLGMDTVIKQSQLHMSTFISDLIVVASFGIPVAVLLNKRLKIRPKKIIERDEIYYRTLRKSMLRTMFVTYIVVPPLCLLVFGIATNNLSVLELMPIVIVAGLFLIKIQLKQVSVEHLHLKQLKRENAPLQVVRYPRGFNNPWASLLFIISIPIFSFFGIWISLGQKSIFVVLALGIVIFALFFFGILLMFKQSAPGWSKKGLYGLKENPSDGEPEYFHDPKRQAAPVPPAMQGTPLPDNADTRAFPASDSLQSPLSLDTPQTQFVQHVYSKEIPPSFQSGYSLQYKLRKTFISSQSRFFGSKQPYNAAKTYGIVRRKMYTIHNTQRGRIIGSQSPKAEIHDIHLFATILEAVRTGHITSNKWSIQLEDLRVARLTARAKASIIFILDLSTSMTDALAAVTAAIESIHQVSYQHRDRVSVIACKNEGAFIVQHPTTNLFRVQRAINELGISGLTPLASGVLRAIDIITAEKRRDQGIIPIVVLVTDGGTCVPLPRDLSTGEQRPKATVKDFFDGITVQLAVKDFLQAATLLKKTKAEMVIVKPLIPADFSSSHGFEALKRFQQITGGKIVVPTKQGLFVVVD